MTTNSYNIPRGLLGAAIFYWGWSLNIWPAGLVMAVILETSYWVPWRMQLQEKDFMRIADLTAVVFAITGVTLLITNLYESLFFLTEWLPLILYLLVCAQMYSSTQAMPLKAIIASLRRRKAESNDHREKTTDIRMLFFFTTLIATSIAAVKSQAFYIMTCILLFWTLWPLRRRHANPLSWLTMTSFAFLSGFILLSGINQLQTIVQEFTTQWLQADWSQRNMQRNSTAMGQIGRLKLSDQIFMRIKSNQPKEMLLQQASYNRFSGITWHMSEQQYHQVKENRNNNRFLLSPDKPLSDGELVISSYLENNEGFLALPLGSYAIENLHNAKLFIDDFGSARIEQEGSLLDIKVFYQTDSRTIANPTSFDLDIPRTHRNLLNSIVDELSLKQLSPIEATVRLQKYFQNNFEYSLIQDSTSLFLNPLSAFLTTVRKGHCEYFATAGALILRAAGIPTRYASGFLMSEFDPVTNQYIVRSRHAHAWTLAFIDGQWTELDFTPSTWVELESDAAPWWQGFYDTASNSKYFFYKWWNAEPRSPENYALFVVTLLTAFILFRKFKPEDFRFHWQKQNSKISQKKNAKNSSPFNKIIHYLEESTLARENGETIKHWIRRMPNLSHIERTTLEQLASQHYQYRFSNARNDTSFLHSFKNDVDMWLSKRNN